MKPRIRPLSNLYHRWGQRIGLDAEPIAQALEAEGLIQRLGPDHYAETMIGPKIPRHEFDRLVMRLLLKYRSESK